MLLQLIGAFLLLASTAEGQVVQKMFNKVSVATFTWMPFTISNVSKTQSECSLACLKEPDTCTAFTFSNENCTLGNAKMAIQLPTTFDPTAVTKIWKVSYLAPVPHILINTGTSVFVDISLDPGNSAPIKFPSPATVVTPQFGFLDSAYNFNYFVTSNINIGHYIWTSKFGSSMITRKIFNSALKLYKYASYTWVGDKLWAVVRTGCRDINVDYCCGYLNALSATTLQKCQQLCQQSAACTLYTYDSGTCYLKKTIGDPLLSDQHYSGSKYCIEPTGIFQDGQYSEGPIFPNSSFPNMVLNPTVVSANDDTGLIFFGTSNIVNSSGVFVQLSNEAWKVNLVTGVWSQLQNTPITRNNARAESFTLSNGTQVVVLMGDGKQKSYTPETWLYNIGNDKWIKTSLLLPGYLKAATSVSVLNRIFYIGTPATGNSAVFEFNEVAGWSQYTVLKAAYTTLVPIVYNMPGLF